jgi:septal ring factor EnvC (AmiA/AmiB activator)
MAKREFGAEAVKRLKAARRSSAIRYNKRIDALYEKGGPLEHMSTEKSLAHLDELAGAEQAADDAAAEAFAREQLQGKIGGTLGAVANVYGAVKEMNAAKKNSYVGNRAGIVSGPLGGPITRDFGAKRKPKV